MDSIRSDEKAMFDIRSSSRLERMSITWKKTTDCVGKLSAKSDRDVMGRMSVQMPIVFVYSNKIATSIRQELDAYPAVFAAVCDPLLDTTK